MFFGHVDWLPDVIQWKGASFGKATWHYWMQDEGVFGVALKVSTELIFLFVLFGAILEKAGAGNYFIKIAFALLGHLRGKHQDLLDWITAEDPKIKGEAEDKIKAALDEYAATFA